MNTSINIAPDSHEQRVFEAGQQAVGPCGMIAGLVYAKMCEANAKESPRLGVHLVRRLFWKVMDDLGLLTCTIQGCLNNPRAEDYHGSFCINCHPGQVFTEGVAQVLTGHDSEETAYLVPDYPFGRQQLRCKKKIWVERSERQGQRVVSRTTNPRAVGEVWNRRQAENYSELVVLYLDREGHVREAAIGYYANEANLTVYLHQFAAAIDEWRSARASQMRVLMRARENIKTSVRAQTTDERGQVIAGAIEKAERRLEQEDFDETCPNADRHITGQPCPMCGFKG